MSAADLLASGRVADAAPGGRAGTPWALVPALARVHALRMVRHPVLLVSVAWSVLGLGLGLPNTPYEKYSAVTGMVAFLMGPLAFFAANLVASSGRRSGADEWTPSLPLTPLHRTVALLLACAAPAALAAVVNGVLLLAIRGDGFEPALRWQHAASVPLTVLGGALLGVAVARLLPWTGFPLVVMVALVSFNAALESGYAYLGFYVDFVEWTGTDAVPALLPGDASWHLLYLLALCGLAASGALLRDARRRWVPFGAGAVLGVLVLVSGWLQLP